MICLFQELWHDSPLPAGTKEIDRRSTRDIANLGFFWPRPFAPLIQARWQSCWQDPTTSMGLGMLCIFSGHVLPSLRWQIMSATTEDMSLRRLYVVLIIGFVANNLLPARIGELVRAYLLGRKKAMGKAGPLPPSSWSEYQKG